MTVDELRQTILNLSPLPDEAPEFTWLHRRIALRKHILNEDLDNFLSWSTISATMNINPDSQHHHLNIWEKETGLRICDLSSIVEFGGGYGAMIKACHNRGFSGQYYSYDFPELLALQKFYLPDVDIKTDLPDKCDLFIAICSMSEAPIKDRQEFLDRFAFDHCLICFQGKWDGVDNHEFFGQFSGKQFQDKLGNHWYYVG